MNRRITIFDTTLRDGEQSPGASMNLPEKMEVAQALVDEFDQRRVEQARALLELLPPEAPPAR